MTTRVVGLVLLVTLTACGSAVKAQSDADASTTVSVVSISITSTSSSLQFTTTEPPAGGPCTAEDLARVTVLPAPAGRVVTQTFGLHLEFGSGFYLDPPPAGVAAKISAEEAWTMMRSRATPSATSAELWLGLWGMRHSSVPSDTLPGAQPSVLAWVLVVHHVAEVGAIPHPAPAPGMTDDPIPSCFWADETIPINAETGGDLGLSIVSTGFGP